MTRRPKSRRGGRRPGAGRPPRAGVARTKGRTLWLTPDEDAAIDAARGETPWQDYVRESVALRIAGVTARSASELPTT